MNLNTSTINENKSMIKDNSNRSIIVKVIEKGKDAGQFNVTVFDKKTKNSEFFKFEKIGEVTRNYDNRDWEPVTPEEAKNKTKVEKSKKDDKVEKKDKPETREPRGDDAITLKDMVDELIAEGILPESLKMKKVRRILRGTGKDDKGMHLREMSVDGFRWVWTTDRKNDVKSELSSMLK